MTEKTWRRVISNRDSLSKDEFAWLAKYKARSTYARGMVYQPVGGLGEGTSHGYYVMLKVSLAHTALEVLGNATGNNIPVTNAALSNALRAGVFNKLLESSGRALTRKAGLEFAPSLPKYAEPDSQHSDLKSFLGLCRNLMFHGTFSPSESGLSSSANRRKLLLTLADDCLAQCETHLDRWLTQVEKSR